jgi:hypothetical protein
MLSLLHATVPSLREFLEKHLPQVSKNWWDDCVYNKLTMMQREIVDRKNIRSLSELDFAALLRIVDQNWFSLSNNAALGPEVRSWVKELQTIRNKWAHMSEQNINKDDLYRDLDTLQRVLVAMKIQESILLNKIEILKQNCLVQITRKITTDSHEKLDSSAQNIDHKELSATVKKVTPPPVKKETVATKSTKASPDKKKEFIWSKASGHNNRYAHFLKTRNPWKQGIMFYYGEEIKLFIQTHALKVPEELKSNSYRVKLTEVLKPIKQRFEELRVKGVYKGNPEERLHTSIKQYCMFWEKSLDTSLLFTEHE